MPNLSKEIKEHIYNCIMQWDKNDIANLVLEIVERHPEEAQGWRESFEAIEKGQDG